MHPLGSEPMTDDDLDREIAAALDVDPSPAFVARVRQRVAQESAPAVWSRSWTIGAVTALAMAVVAAAIFQIQRDTQRIAVPIESRPLAGFAELQSSHVASGFSRTSPPGFGRTPASGFRRTSASAPASRAPSPEILIDIREANALRALFAAASRGQIDLTPLAAALAATPSEAQPPPEIVIAPLVIPPLAPEPGEGERQ
jgi:hypothetical protein